VAALAAAEGARRRMDTPAAAAARVQGPRVHGLGTEGVVLLADAPVASAALASSAYGAAAAVAFHPAHSGVVAVGTSAGHVLLTPMAHRTGTTDDVAVLVASFSSSSSSAAAASAAASASAANAAGVAVLAFGARGEWLLVGHADGTVALWDVQRHTLAKLLPGAHAAAVVRLTTATHNCHPPRPSPAQRRLLSYHTLGPSPSSRRAGRFRARFGDVVMEKGWKQATGDVDVTASANRV
jgi:hypothetical protein